MPGLSILQPANETTPPTAAFDRPGVQVSVPPPGFEVSVRVTVAVLVVTRLPPGSWTWTVGWVAKAVPAGPPPGWTTNIRPFWPGDTVNGLLVAGVSPLDDATSV